MLTPNFVKILPASDALFVWKEDAMQNPTGWHFHPEIELLWVQQGTGTRFIGDSIEPFQAGEIALLGPMLPHSWQAERSPTEPRQAEPRQAEQPPQAIVVQFRREFLGATFFDKTEFAPIAQLLDRAEQGLLFDGATAPADRLPTAVTSTLRQMGGQSPTGRLCSLLTVLEHLAAVPTYRSLARPGFLKEYHRDDRTDNRLDRVYQFTIDQFGREITLAEAAAVAGMSEAAFCRYFRRHTRKTYIEFLNDIRVGYACRLLITTQQDVAQVCYACGFGTLSNFNRRFRRVTGLTPTQYRARVVA